MQGRGRGPRLKGGSIGLGHGRKAEDFKKKKAESMQEMRPSPREEEGREP
jgi:hypothetical protein